VPTAPIVSEPSPPSPAPGRDQRVTAIGPNWFACVMGTGIVANAGAVLPFHLAGRSSFVLTVWIVAASLLIALVVATLAHWVRHPAIARSHGRDLAMAPFYGAPPMALLTVGAGALLVGYRLIGLRAAVDADWVLWIAGTVLGLLSATVMPYRLFTHGETRARDAAFGGWLMPIVPPMVSAATGALLIPHVASRSGRASLLYGCYALFGLSLIASIIVITLIWGRLARHGSDDAPRVPTLWIVLGPLGQSITAAGLLAANAHLAVEPTFAAAMVVFGVLYGVPVWGFALLWCGLASAITVRAARRGLRFALNWWSFVFPVGTVVTGTVRLAIETDLAVFRWASAGAYVLLLAAWLTVAIRTIRSTARGEFSVPPLPAVA